MNSITQAENIFNIPGQLAKPTAVLDQVDLLDYEAVYCREQYQNMLAGATDYYRRYKAAVSARQQLAKQITKNLLGDK